LWQPDQQHAVVRAGCVLPGIGEVQILGDQETAVGLSGLPHEIVVLTGELFIRNGVDVVAKFSQQRDEPTRRFSSSLLFTARTPPAGNTSSRCDRGHLDRGLTRCDEGYPDELNEAGFDGEFESRTRPTLERARRRRGRR
jgi:hypothetical protein